MRSGAPFLLSLNQPIFEVLFADQFRKALLDIGKLFVDGKAVPLLHCRGSPLPRSGTPHDRRQGRTAAPVLNYKSYVNSECEALSHQQPPRAKWPQFMAVLPGGADIDAYLKDATARFDWKAWRADQASHVKVRVGQQKQKKAK